MIINKCGKFYTIKKNETETIENLIERSWFVVNNIHLNSIDNPSNENYKESLRNSRFWYNINVLECSYDEETHKKIQEIENKIFV